MNFESYFPLKYTLLTSRGLFPLLQMATISSSE